MNSYLSSLLMPDVEQPPETCGMPGLVHRESYTADTDILTGLTVSYRIDPPIATNSCACSNVTGIPTASMTDQKTPARPSSGALVLTVCAPSARAWSSRASSTPSTRSPNRQPPSSQCETVVWIPISPLTSTLSTHVNIITTFT